MTTAHQLGRQPDLRAHASWSSPAASPSCRRSSPPTLAPDAGSAPSGSRPLLLHGRRHRRGARQHPRRSGSASTWRPTARASSRSCPALRPTPRSRPLLHERGLALHNMGSLPHISVAGACATGTHGSGDTWGRWRRRRSPSRWSPRRASWCGIGAGDPDFPGAVLSLGALGVVTRLWLRAEPTYEVTQRVVGPTCPPGEVGERARRGAGQRLQRERLHRPARPRRRHVGVGQGPRRPPGHAGAGAGRACPGRPRGAPGAGRRSAPPPPSRAACRGLVRPAAALPRRLRAQRRRGAAERAVPAAGRRAAPRRDAGRDRRRGGTRPAGARDPLGGRRRPVAQPPARPRLGDRALHLATRPGAGDDRPCAPWRTPWRRWGPRAHWGKITATPGAARPVRSLRPGLVRRARARGSTPQARSPTTSSPSGVDSR